MSDEKRVKAQVNDLVLVQVAGNTWLLCEVFSTDAAGFVIEATNRAGLDLHLLDGRTPRHILEQGRVGGAARVQEIVDYYAGQTFSSLGQASRVLSNKLVQRASEDPEGELTLEDPE